MNFGGGCEVGGKLRLESDGEANWQWSKSKRRSIKQNFGRFLLFVAHIIKFPLTMIVDASRIEILGPGDDPSKDAKNCSLISSTKSGNAFTISVAINALEATLGVTFRFVTLAPTDF